MDADAGEVAVAAEVAVGAAAAAAKEVGDVVSAASALSLKVVVDGAQQGVAEAEETVALRQYKEEETALTFSGKYFL